MSPNYDPDIFWDERCKKFGHTGWSDSLLYRYDQPLRLKAVEKALSQAGIDINEKTKVLDIGCGTGDLIQLLAVKGAKVVGIDISREVVMRTKKRFEGNSKVQIFVSRVEDLNFPSESFDLVTSITVLQHIVEEGAFLSAVQNIISVLKKGGHLLLLESAPLKKPKEQRVTHKIIRSRHEWIDVFEGLGCSLVAELTYPQWALIFLRMLDNFTRNLFRLNRSSTNPVKTRISSSKGKAGFVLKILYSLYNVRRPIIFTICYPIDHWLFLPTISKYAEYRILIFKVI